MNFRFSIESFSSPPTQQNEYYTLFLIAGSGTYTVDETNYTYTRLNALFLSPYQHLTWHPADHVYGISLQFHTDFYCIEYHRKEVACNGLLFNNAYAPPHIALEPSIFEEIQWILKRMQVENAQGNPYSEAVLRTYLQLILALCSKEKQKEAQTVIPSVAYELTAFKTLVEQYYRTEHGVAFYARKLSISAGVLSKKIKQAFHKTPRQLIQERLILEAKKLLQLTPKSIKEIAGILHFEDEFYFSRYFKKKVGIAPTHYREKVSPTAAAK